VLEFAAGKPGTLEATFKIYLPNVEASVIEQAPDAAVENVPGAAATLLLVEDETALRQAGATYLQSKGYSVLAAANGEEALRTAQDFSGAIDLLLTDIIMPGMSGAELAQRLRLLRPGIHILYMSGCTQNTILQNGIGNLACQYLQKPFSYKFLLKKLAEILQDKAPAVESA